MDADLIVEIEQIPVNGLLYYRIHKIKLDAYEPDLKKKIMPVAFDPQPKGSTKMSTDWCKYSTPQQSRDRGKIPTDNGVVS